MIMNRIIVEQKELKLNDQDVIIEKILKENLILHIYGKVNCGVLNLPKVSNIEIYLHDKAIFNIDLFVQLDNSNNKINIYSAFQSNLNLSYACNYKNENILEIKNHITDNETKTNILVKAVENKGTIEIKAEGLVLKNTYSNIFNESIKVLVNYNNSVKIKPDLIINNNEVIANHNATISNISEKDLFYLMSKGIKEEMAIQLIKLGFLREVLNLDELRAEVK